MDTNAAVTLIEEMIELKIRQHAGACSPSAQSNPQLARVLAETNQADRARLQQIKAELAKAWPSSAPSVPSSETLSSFEPFRQSS